MNPHGAYHPAREASFSPPPLLPRTRPILPVIPADPSSLKSLNTKSPVRRKPLPPSAFSPTSTITTSVHNGGRQPSIDQKIEPLTTTTTRSESGSSLVVRDLDHFPHDGNTPVLSSGPGLPRVPEEVLQGAKPLPLLPQVTSSPPLDSSPQTFVTPFTGNVEGDYFSKNNEMALKPGARPPPLRMDSSSSVKSLSANDAKKPQTPGGKVSSFFGWKRTASPSTDSLSTENSDNGRSPGPSTMPGSPQTSAYSSRALPPNIDSAKLPPTPPVQYSAGFGGPLHSASSSPDDMSIKVAQLESELREISSELAGSIRREMDLEDLVEKLQLEAVSSTPGVVADRTSDYFSDSGTSSVRPPGSEAGDIEKMKRDMEQQRAQVRVDMSQKWQDERHRRKALESHVQILEAQVSSSRRDHSESSDLAARTRELETALEDARRRLTQERQAKENLEDLLTGLRVELEQHRNQRDNLRDEVVPQLKSQIEGLETNLSDSQKQSYDVARMQQEIKKLRAENARLTQQGAHGINSIAEDDSPLSPTAFGGLARSNSTAAGLSRSNTLRSGLTRSGSISRSNTQVESPLESLPEKLKAVEQQRDALHNAVKYLLRRQNYQSKESDKKFRVVEMERDRAMSTASPQKFGYEKDVKGLRSEINLLRKRADDALEQKWQCEKGLGGLKMDLDRSKQETAGLRKLLQERDSSNMSGSSLQDAYNQLQTERKGLGSLGTIAEEKELADQVEEQVHANASLRTRLQEAVARGENNQGASAAQISELEIKLRKLEDIITAAQTQSENAVMKHEEEIRVIRASHNAQLLRARSGSKTPGLLSPTPRSPLSPLFMNSKRSPRLDKTSTGPGMALHQALKTEYLEYKVAELEKALSDADAEMGEVVGRMNTAQIGVAELQSERDEALRHTRRLEAAIMAERQKVQSLADR